MSRKSGAETEGLNPSYPRRHHGVGFRYRNTEGFTLLEVMVAVAILAGVIITVITSLNYHIGVVGRNKDIIIATFLAREKLEEIRIDGITETRQGDFAPRFEGFSWKYDRAGLDFQGIEKVNITVSWEKGRKVSLETYELSQ
jgi:general secretion pathway protein I